MQRKPKYYRGLFLSSWLPLVYDFWVWLAVLGNTKKLRESILEFVPQNPNVLIDLATGTGENALLLKQRFPYSKVLASDLSQGMLKVAKEKATRQAREIEFSFEDATKTNYPSEIADFVAISFALHDLPGEKRVEVMKEALRLLKPGGIFVIYEYHLPKNLLVRIPLIIQFLLVENLDAWRMLKENLTEKLKEAGFKNTKKKTYYKGLAQIVVGSK
ncbi:methyltransferase domain-containing protein [Patescibacteria group bacterium]|nr:methyltransferase domain-containing protein [Patescibacteria group bacterium]